MELLSSARLSLSRKTRYQELRTQTFRDLELRKSEKVIDVHQAWFGCGADVLYEKREEGEEGGRKRESLCVRESVCVCVFF